MSALDKIYINPEFNSWNKVLEENLELRLGVDAEKTIKAKSLELRTIMYSLACYFSKKLNIEIPESDFLEELGVVITAHQPVLDHPGILIKKQLLSLLTKRKKNLIGVNVIIDTDLSDNFKYQERVEDIQKFKTLLLKANPSAYLFKPKDYKLTKDAKDITNLEALAKEYTNLDIIELLTLFRRTYEEDSNYLELPFSLFLKQADVQKFIFEFFLISAETLFSKYNYVLDGFRKTNKIKNKANPFPNLESKENTLELPFWIIDDNKKKREPLYFSQINDGENFESIYHNKDYSFKLTLNEFMQISPLPEGVFIAPRALLTTTILRVFLSDLFIHGKGGEKYDQCTDIFILDYFQKAPPKFVTASRDLMLYKEEASRVFEYNELKNKKREMAFHPKKFIESNIFSESDVEELEKFSKEKQSLIEELKQKKAKKESSAKETKLIKEIEKKVFNIVELAFIRKYKIVSKLSQNELNAIISREYPYFFFDKKDLQINI